MFKRPLSVRDCAGQSCLWPTRIFRGESLSSGSQGLARSGAQQAHAAIQVFSLEKCAILILKLQVRRCLVELLCHSVTQSLDMTIGVKRKHEASRGTLGSLQASGTQAP